MNIEDFTPIRDKLEPEAMASNEHDYLTVSVAVSLKRIADALEEQIEIALAVTQGLPKGEE